jgi:acyl-CoA reductase-like NAD-dependent aldehyde dehydrogenase
VTSRHRLPVVNPATGAMVDEIACHTPEQIAVAAAQARDERQRWRERPLSDRKQAIERFRVALERDTETLARTLTTEMGKPIAQARNELKAVLGRIDFFLAEVDSATADETVLDDGKGLREIIVREPLGVVANISAWNYPYFVGTNVFIPALLAGNTVLYKPSEFAALTGLAIAQRLHAAGIPSGAFIPVIGAGDVGAVLMDQAIDGLFFTGSYATGKRIGERLGGRMLPVQLELGGKDPAYVCDDVDIAKAAEATADGAFYNTGQSCCSVERIYVHRRIADRFIEAFSATVRGFVVGDPSDEHTYIGPLTRHAQLGVLDRHVADAVGKGARLVAGGKRIDRPGNWFEPTVLTGVDHRMEVMRDESFGPIIGLQVVADDDEALRLMADTAYGLTAAVYTADEARARRLLCAIDTGTVYWNCCDRVSPRLPWSGRGHSGIGSTLARTGIAAFTKPKAWHLRSP